MSTATPETTAESISWLRHVFRRHTPDRREVWINRFVRRYRPVVWCAGHWRHRQNARVAYGRCQSAGLAVYRDETSRRPASHRQTIDERINAKVRAQSELRTMVRWWRQLSARPVPSIPLIQFALTSGYIRASVERR